MGLSSGESKPKQSDIDVLVDFEENASLFDLVGFGLFLEEKFNQKVDVVSKRALREEIRNSVLTEAIYCMRRNHKLYLKDILNAMESIRMFMKGMSREEFEDDDKTTSAVIRKFEIIGGATKQVPKEITRKYPQVPWRQMAGMRDKLIHFYFGVDYRLVWMTAKEVVP